jgi:hypothetical protein
MSEDQKIPVKLVDHIYEYMTDPINLSKVEWEVRDDLKRLIENDFKSYQS